jgi:signal transduction protein with GAF and PtsI domain
MTIQEINDLQVSDVEDLLKSRLFEKEDPQPEEMPDYSNEDLEAELVLYQAELTAIENERLRIADLQDRFSNIRNAAFWNVHSDVSNPKAWCRDILLNMSPNDAEAAMVALENEHTSVTNAQTSVQYVNDRAKEYAKIDHLLKEALVEKELGDSTKWDAYILLRDTIKTQYPKP